MRIELAGTLVHPDPLVLRYATNDHFYPANWIQLDYTHFEVICIGAGGGMGGGIHNNNTNYQSRYYGGAGGGGGYHRVRGLLSALPIDCPIIVGTGGAVGVEQATDMNSTTNGGNGGYSSFNTNTCRASGGMGGKRVSDNGKGGYLCGDGGDGGVGNRTNPGGGGIGGTPNDHMFGGGTPGEDGNLLFDIGKGGGGGAGGFGTIRTAQPSQPATAGGRGAYNPSDMSVYGPGSPVGADGPNGIMGVIGGGASGAKASPLNGLPTVYGQSKGQFLPGLDGIVIVRLTAE